MASTNQNATIWSGDSTVLQFTVTDDAGDAVSLSGASISWKAARSVGETAVLTKSTGGSGISITNAAGGIFQVTLDAADTATLAGDYFHEAQVTDASSNVTTVATGWLTVKLDLIA